MPERNNRFNRMGFTLVEAIIAASIIGIIMITVAALYVQTGETTAMVAYRSEATFEAQEAVERMIDTVRNSDELTVIESDSFEILMGPDTIKFSYDAENGDILRNGEAYASNITDFTVSYFDIDGEPVVLPEDVSRMDISITATQDDAVKTVQTSVTMRRRT
ncbi:prepilin-type N-terminal cleavage/methylation domain-containing protein [bacterium]|nr:prepilin-type N-terminal cleavage/methylation domain-containing protein [bacterium]